MNSSLLEIAPAGPKPPSVPDLGIEEVLGGDLAPAFAESLRITRTRARNFYYGLRLTPEPKRSALYALYAWMREADDIADGPGYADTRSRLAALDEFRTATERVYAGRAASGNAAWWPAFARTYSAFGFTRECFDATLEGVRADIEREPEEGLVLACQSMHDLERYCAQVASTVGVLCLRIWGIRSGSSWDEACALGIERGIAFQLTNILRDLGEDAREKRMYIPQDLLAQHELSPDSLLGWSDASRCAEVVGAVADRARRAFEDSEPLDEIVHADGAAAMWAMTRIYSGLLERLNADPKRGVLGPRVRLPKLVKLGIGLRASLRARRRM